MNSQALMYISLGFVAASLIAVLFSKFIFKNAYKAATKEMRGQIPLNQAELAAERDRLRAEFAVNINKLEYKIAALHESELKLRVDSTKDREHKLRSIENLEESIKQAVKWEQAHEQVEREVSLLNNKLNIQNKLIEDLQGNEAKFQLDQKEYEKSRLAYQLADAKFLKLKNDQDESKRSLQNSDWQLEKITAELNLQNIELEATRNNNISYKAKISEISTEMLYLGQQLHAKKISLDLSDKAIDRYKNKLLTQKLALRDASIKDKAVYAVKSKLNGTANLNLEAPDLAEKRSTPSLTAISTKNLVTSNSKPKLVAETPKNDVQSITGLRSRMNSMANGTDD